MRPRLHRIVFILLSLLCWQPATVRADDWPISRGPSRELVPYRYHPDHWKQIPSEFLDETPACILYSGVTHLVDEDGTIETITHEVTRLNGRKGIEKLGEYRTITFDPSYQQLTLNEARVLKADGQIVPIAPQHLQLRDPSTDYQVYDRDKQLVISFPNLEVGDTIEVKWTTRGKNPEHQGQFFAMYNFGDDHYPVVLDEMRVRVPKTRRLKFATSGGTLQPEVRSQGSFLVYHWRASNRKQLPQDDNLPSKEELRLLVSCSTFADWEAIAAWKRGLRSDCWQSTPEIKQIVEQVTNGLKAPLDKARALTYWVRRHIRYVSVGEKHDFTPNAPCQVLGNRFGDCKDQSQLLAVMLREAGLNVALATLGVLGDGQIQPDVPSPWGTHAILLLTLDGQEHWIDTTITFAPWDFLPRDDRDRLAYVVDDRTIRLVRTPRLTPECNRIEQSTSLAIATDGSSHCRQTSTYYGLAAMVQRDEWMEVPAGERRRLIATEIQNHHSKARLHRVAIDESLLREFDKPVRAEFDFQVSAHFRGDPVREGSLADNLIWNRLVSINLDYERQVPLDLGAPFESVHLFTVTLPPAYCLDTLPESQLVHSKWGSFSVRAQAHPKHRRTIDVEFRTRIHQARVEPADFDEFRKFHEEITRYYRVWLSLKPTQDLADAPLLETLLAFVPGDTTSAVILAQLYEQSGRFADARRVVERARKQHPDSAVLWELTVKVAKNLEEEEAAYQELVRRFPDEPKYVVALGETRIERGNYAGGRAVLEPVSRRGPEHWRGLAHYQLARALLFQKQPGQALEQFQAAARANPESVATAAALQFKGQVLLALGRADDAAAAFREGLKLEPDDPELLHDLIGLELAAGNRTQALDHLRRYTVVVGDDLTGLIKAADLHLRLERYDDALDLASRARDQDFHAVAQRVLGLVYFHRRDYQRALLHLGRADVDAGVVNGLIRSSVALGRLQDAEQQLERIDTMAASTPELDRACALVIALVQRRAAILAETRVPADQTAGWIHAIDAFVCAEHAHAERWPAPQVEALLGAAFADGVELGCAHALRALLALESGQLGKALADAEHAIRLSPKEPRGYYVRGRVRFERASAGCLTDLKRAAELSRLRDGVILHWLANALARAGRPGEALVAQRLAVLLRPDDPDLRNLLRELEQSAP
jgi:tetratricopeptide (TPR) repeat protein